MTLAGDAQCGGSAGRRLSLSCGRAECAPAQRALRWWVRGEWGVAGARALSSRTLLRHLQEPRSWSSVGRASWPPRWASGRRTGPVQIFG